MSGNLEIDLMASAGDEAGAPQFFDIAVLSDIGAKRSNNEDACAHLIDDTGVVVFAVADGVGGYEGGEIASQMAVEVTLEAYRDSPAQWGVAKRLYRAVQRANIEIHNRALTVPELRRMATTLTAVAIEDGLLSAVHVGDCRLYLLRHHNAKQITKDHTVIGERVRMGMLSEANARKHPDRSALTRSVGRELIVSSDMISMPLHQHDELVLCSDGMWSVLDDAEFIKLTRGCSADKACRALIDEANARGTADNLTVAFFRQIAPTPDHAAPAGWLSRMRNLFSRG